MRQAILWIGVTSLGEYIIVTCQWMSDTNVAAISWKMFAHEDGDRIFKQKAKS
jgi:hypothetical protein